MAKRRSAAAGGSPHLGNERVNQAMADVHQTKALWPRLATRTSPRRIPPGTDLLFFNPYRIASHDYEYFYLVG